MKKNNSATPRTLEQKPPQNRRYSSQNKKDNSHNNSKPIAGQNTRANTNADNFDNLLANENDSPEQLKRKNYKLRQIIIQASGKIKELTNKYEERENEYNMEKTQILNELDKISKNYQMYAQSYKDLAKTKKDFEVLVSKYNQNNKVINSYQKNIQNLLTNLMQIEESIRDFTGDKNNFTESFKFLDFLRQKINVNILKYRKDIDAVSFKGFYECYNNYIQGINNVDNKDDNNDCSDQSDEDRTIYKKRPVKARKKEYAKYKGELSEDCGVISEDDSPDKSKGNRTIDENTKGRKNYKFNRGVINIRQRTNSFDRCNTNDL